MIGPVSLTPTPDRRVVNGQAAFGHHFLDVTEAERKAQVPTNASRDDFWPKMTSTEDGRAAWFHRTTLKVKMALCNTSGRNFDCWLDVQILS
jgi:hypothetical protein